MAAMAAPPARACSLAARQPESCSSAPLSLCTPPSLAWMSQRAWGFLKSQNIRKKNPKLSTFGENTNFYLQQFHFVYLHVLGIRRMRLAFLFQSLGLVHRIRNRYCRSKPANPPESTECKNRNAPASLLRQSFSIPRLQAENNAIFCRSAMIHTVENHLRQLVQNISWSQSQLATQLFSPIQHSHLWVTKSPWDFPRNL